MRLITMATEAEIEAERLLNNVKREVKQIMEEAVTKKFIYEESNCILALCSAVEACLLHGLKKRALGLFKNHSTVALLQKISKTFEPAATVLKQLQDLEAAAAADHSRPHKWSEGSVSRSPSLPRRPPTNLRYLWIRLALFEKQLSRIIEHLAENSEKFYEPDALMSDPVHGPILSSLLMGPCALDYTRVKTADSYWTDPPAEELLQRHRIHGNSTTSVTRADSPKRPGLQVSIRRHPSWTSDDNVRSSPPSAKEYVASLHQNNKSTLLYGKNNVTVQPKEDVEPLAGYLSLHQLNDASVLLKWMPNQLMNGCYDKEDTDRRPGLSSRLQPYFSARHGHGKPLFWDYAVLVNMCDIVYLHCHQPGSGAGGGVLVMVGQDGVQRPPIQFPRGGHFLAFLSCLENGLQPAKCLDPPLWSQRGKGKVFPKLRRRTSQTNGSSRSSGDEADVIEIGDTGETVEDADMAADYVFRIINVQQPTVTQGVTTPLSLPFFWHVWMPYSSTSQPSAAVSTTTTFSRQESAPHADQPVATNTTTSHRAMVKQLCDTMARQIKSRAFYGWLSYCRQLKTVRTHLSGLTIGSICDAVDLKYTHGLTEAVWSQLCPHGVVLDGVEMYRCVYYGGCEHSLRRVVWLYLLGHYEIAMTTEEQQARDASSREQYERIMSEWMAVEAIVRQREAETQANVKVTSESQDIGGPAGQFMLQHKDSTLSNEVFESLDSDTDYLPRQSTVAEESCSAVTSPEDASHMSVSFHTGAATTDCNATNTTTNVVSGGSTLATEQDADAADQALQKEIDGDGNEEVGQVTTRNRTRDLRNIIVTDASIDHGDLLPPPVLPNVLELRLTPLAERNEHLSASKESLILPASPQSNTSHGGVYTTELLDNVALNLHRIDKDVARCDRNYVYFLVPGNLDKLRNVVSTYVWQHLDVGYMQGMCDLVAPLLVVFDDECLAFSCFTELMKRMIHNFPTGTMMDQHFANMRSLIQILDPEMFEHMHHTGDFTHFYFSYRWFLLDFKRELTYDGTFAVWETIWAAKYVSSSHFVLFVALAFIELYRDIVLDNHMDFTDVLKFFNEMAERHDVSEVLKLARALVQKLQQLAENK